MMGHKVNNRSKGVPQYRAREMAESRPRDKRVDWAALRRQNQARAVAAGYPA